jgi:hypothetical protein
MAKKKTNAASSGSSKEEKFPVDLHYTPRFQPTVEVLSPQIITINHFFDSRYCIELISQLSQLGLTTTPLIKSKDYAARFNDRLLITDADAAGNLWNQLRNVLLYEYNDEMVLNEFNDAKGLNPQLRVYRYTKGHHFGKHYDESVRVGKLGRTKWTLLIYLSGGEELLGGDTIFYEGMQSLAVHPVPGLALLHRHGDMCLLHEAQLVSAGVKWVLRSDVWF